MNKFAAIVNAVAGCVIALIGAFVVCRTSAYLCAAPRDQYGMIAWAILVDAIGFWLIIGGVGRVRRGATLLQENQVSDDS